MVVLPDRLIPVTRTQEYSPAMDRNFFSRALLIYIMAPLDQNTMQSNFSHTSSLESNCLKKLCLSDFSSVTMFAVRFAVRNLFSESHEQRNIASYAPYALKIEVSP